MRFSSLIIAIALGCAVAAVPGVGRAQEVPNWPDEQEKQLQKVDAELLEVQRERFAVLFFSKDKKEKKRLEKRFTDLQKERRKLLRATGRVW